MKNPNSKESITSSNTSWRNIFLWCLLALFLRWQIIEPRWIPSESMLPTLEIQDRILVEKIRPKINTALKKNINRQSLVIFKPPQQLIAAGYDENSALIKRVIGLPGDEIEVHDGKLFLNKLIIKEPGIKEPMLYEMDPVIVPNNSLWVLGDNRNNSLDSHIWGALPQKNVIGIAIFRYWPLKKLGVIRFPSL